MINKVILKNWRSHFKSELEFSEGTNCLIGRMGSGKSSVMDAICFGLFGTFPLLQQRKIKLEDAVMKKPKRQVISEIEIFFDVNSDSYSVKRTIEKGRSSAELRKNGKLLEAPQSQKVTEEVEKLLKVDYDLFTRAVYSEQNQLDMFLTIPKGQRMKKIDELLKLDRFEKARSSVVSLLNKFETTLEETEKFINIEETESIKKEIAELNRELENEKNESEEMKKKIDILDRELKEKRQEILEYEKNETEISKLNNELTALAAKNNMLKSELQETETLLYGFENIEETEKNMSEEYQLIKNEIKAMQSGLEALQKQLMENSVVIEALKKKASVIEDSRIESERIRKILDSEKYRQVKNNLEAKTKTTDEKKLSIKTIDLKLSELKKSTEGLEKSDSRCPVCYHGLTESAKNEIIGRNKNLASELASEKTKTESALEELHREISELEIFRKEADACERRLASLENVESECREIMEAIKTAEDFAGKNQPELERKKSLFEEKRSLLETMQEEINKLRVLAEKSRESEKKKNAYNENLEKIKELEKNMSAFKTVDKSKMQAIRTETEELLSSKAGVSGRINAIDMLGKEKEKRMDEMKKKIEISERYGAEYRKTKGILEQLKLLEKALLSTQMQLRKNFVSAINQVMHEIWQELYPYSDFSSIRLSVNIDYTLEVEDINGWSSVDAVSGGERSIACLVLRIAFALVLAPQLRWLVLDEPTHNLDSKAVEELAKILKDRISEYVEQVFIITHDPALENAVSGCLYKFEKDDFTKAEKIE